MSRTNLKGYIIEKYSNMGDAYTCSRLKKEAEEKNIRLDIIGIQDVTIQKEGIFCDRKPIESCDFVINRYKWGNIKHEISQLAERRYNAQEAFEQYVNKYQQVKRLHSEAFFMPQYCLSTAAGKYAYICELLGKPFVAKGLESSQGSEVFLIHNEKEMEQLVKQYGVDKEWLFEEFIAESFGKDIRFYSIGGNVVACMTRKSKGDFRANVALGATVEQYGITAEIEQTARDIYEQTSLDFLGIDLLYGKEKPYFCEINVMPGIEGIEKATGVNVAGKIVETVERDFYNE